VGKNAQSEAKNGAIFLAQPVLILRQVFFSMMHTKIIKIGQYFTELFNKSKSLAFLKHGVVKDCGFYNNLYTSVFANDLELLTADET